MIFQSEIQVCQQLRLLSVFFLFKIVISLTFIFKEKDKDINTFLVLFQAYSQNLVLTAQFKLRRLPFEASIILFHPRPLKSEFWWVGLRHQFFKKLSPGDLNMWSSSRHTVVPTWGRKDSQGIWIIYGQNTCEKAFQSSRWQLCCVCMCVYVWV